MRTKVLQYGSKNLRRNLNFSENIITFKCFYCHLAQCKFLPFFWLIADYPARCGSIAIFHIKKFRIPLLQGHGHLNRAWDLNRSLLLSKPNKGANMSSNTEKWIVMLMEQQRMRKTWQDLFCAKMALKPSIIPYFLSNWYKKPFYCFLTHEKNGQFQSTY